MKKSDLDADLERLFRNVDSPPPSPELLTRIDALIDRRSRRLRALAILGVVAAVAALVVTVPWIVSAADAFAASTGSRDFETAVTSAPVVSGGLLALALVVPWLWLRTIAPARTRGFVSRK